MQCKSKDTGYSETLRNLQVLLPVCAPAPRMQRNEAGSALRRGPNAHRCHLLWHSHLHSKYSGSNGAAARVHPVQAEPHIIVLGDADSKLT